MRKLLMHACCGPCFSYIEKDLKENGLQIKDDYEKVEYTACFYNPNIHPKVEYERRRDTFVDLCNKVECDYVVIDEYDMEGYIKYVALNVGTDKKYITRCEYCYYMRLKKVFEYAKENGYDLVSTTLTISPYQNHDLIIMAGKILEKEYNIEFIYCDYRTYFRQGQKLSRDLGLYMQKYCGCVFSMDSRKVGILMKKYSKDHIKKRGFLKFIIVLVSIILILSVALFAYILIKNNIVIENISEVAKDVSNDVAAASTPVIIDNAVVGAVYDGKWVLAEKYYMQSSNKSDFDIDVYNKGGKKGSYKLTEVKKGNANAIFSNTTNSNFSDEYFAIAKSDKDAMLVPSVKKQTVTEEEISDVKRALGFYRLFNSSVKISEVYLVTLSQGNTGKIICATNQANKSMGAYSTVIYVDSTNKASIIKFNYIKNLNKAESWPIYSFKFAGDFNLDGTNEIVIQETKEFEVKYDILELQKDKFVEVLSTVIK